MHSEVMNCERRAVFPTPGDPNMATRYDVTSGLATGDSWAGGGVPAKLLLRDLFFLNESPRFIIPETQTFISPETEDLLFLKRRHLLVLKRKLFTLFLVTFSYSQTIPTGLVLVLYLRL
jgi:hypothetical protein